MSQHLGKGNLHLKAGFTSAMVKVVASILGDGRPDLPPKKMTESLFHG